jgi:hypothetical protein
MTINVTPVNDPPRGMDKTIAVAQLCGQGYPHTFTVSDFGYSDPFDAPPNALLAVKLSFNGGGSLLLNGNLIGTGQATVPAGDLAAGKLVFAIAGQPAATLPA